MADLSAALDAYVRNAIALSKKDISEAAKSREWFLTRIQNVIAQRKNEPTLYAPKPTVYYGSYFKGTKVADVDEFDVLVVMDCKSGLFTMRGEAAGTGQGTADTNHRYDQRFMKEDGSGVSPAKLLNWLKGVVEEVVDAFDGEAPERAGQAVTARIASKDLTIDLVPAGVFQHKVTGRTFYDIPRGDKANGWITTAPEDDMKRLADFTARRSNFKNVIRIAKRIRDQYNFIVSSFALETAVIDRVHAFDWHNQFAPDTLETLSYLAQIFRGKNIPDPFDKETNLLADVEQLDWYAERLETIIEELRKCMLMQDQAEANERVHRILDNE